MTMTKVGYGELTEQWYRANEMERETLIEAIIDAGNVKMLLAYASQVCSVKADHIRENWDDKALERAWRKASNQIDTCANALPYDAGIGYGS